MIKKILFSLLLIITANVLLAQQTTFDWAASAPNETGVIPDNNFPPTVNGDSAVLTIEVSGLPNRIDPLAFIQTAFDITHTATGDLELYLKSPEGTELILIKNVGANGDTNFTGTVISQDADAGLFSDSVAPFTGKFFPTENPPGLSKFDGENPNGIWTLRIFDMGLGDNGILNSWSLTFSTAPLNLFPTAVNDLATTDEDVSKEIDITFNDTDSDGSIDKTKVTTIKNPKKGTFTLDTPSGKINYVPNAGYFGKDTMSYMVKDNKGANSNEAFVYITINDVVPNAPPVAKNDSAETNKGVAVTIAVTQNDEDDNNSINKSTVTIVTGPKSGIAEIINGDIKYTPNTSFIGNDTLTYKVKDTQGEFSNVARVTIKVKELLSENIAPFAVNDTFILVTLESLSATGYIIHPLDNDYDTDGTIDTSSFTIIKQPSKGTATYNVENATLDYVSTNEGIINDTITYQIKDNEGLISDTATIFIQVGTSGINSLGYDYNSIFAYPNPSNGKIKMKLPESLGNQNAILRVYDIKGSKVQEMKQFISNETEIDLSNLPNGIYTVVLNANQQNYSGKVEILK